MTLEQLGSSRTELLRFQMQVAAPRAPDERRGPRSEL